MGEHNDQGNTIKIYVYNDKLIEVYMHCVKCNGMYFEKEEDFEFTGSLAEKIYVYICKSCGTRHVVDIYYSLDVSGGKVSWEKQRT